VFSKKIVINLEKKDDLVELEPLGDIHVGHKGFREDLYVKAVERVAKQDNRYTLFMGDQLDAITPYDKRFNPDTSVEHDIDNQREKWQDLTQRLIDVQAKVKAKEYNEKIWGLLHGNHEYNIREITRPYIENLFCKFNNIDFLGSRAVIGLEVRHKNKILNQWTILAIHGTGGSRPETMFDHMKMNHYADVFLCGHSHQKRYQPEAVVDFDFATGKSYEREIHLVNTGTFCETLIDNVDGYMDRKNKVILSSIGTATLSFDAYNGKIIGHI